MSPALLLALALPVAAQTSAFRLVPEQTTVLIGGPFDMIGEAVLPEGFAMDAPDEGSDTGAFAVTSVRFGAPSKSADGTRIPIRLRAAVFALGEQTLPALAWPIRSASSAAGILKSEPVRVTVVPPKPSEGDGGDIRDIRGPYSPDMSKWILLGLILSTAAAGCAFYLWKRRKKESAGSPAEKAADLRSFEEIALAEIEALSGMGLGVKDFYDRLSDILRLYVERRFGIPALTETSRDFLRGLRERGIDEGVRASLKRLLERADMAKFAKFQPPSSQLEEDRAEAKEVVRRLAPKPPPAETVRDMAGGTR